MRTMPVIAAVVTTVVAALAAVLTAPPPTGITCALKSAYSRDGQAATGPAQTVSYRFLPENRFAQDYSISSMTVSASTITLGEASDAPSGAHFGAIEINRASGSYEWRASGPGGWAVVTTGHCK